MAQDDDGFEIRSLASSLDEGINGSPDETPSGAERTASPAAAKPVASAQQHRESLDGETIFAVGEDGDRWSDESPRNSAEQKGLIH